MKNIDKKIIGSSPAVTQLKKMILLVAPSDSPTIIYGPTGSGKELVAEALHQESRRKGNFITLNCAAIPKELIEAELFGFEKGSFTGALKTSPGKFEQAQNGTLFLDEIGDMPAEVQTKLLRVIESAAVTKVGGSRSIKLNVRIVCATHKDLEKLVGEKKFREDLLFRLNVFPIDVPSLKSRKEDLPDILEHIINLKYSSSSSSSRPYFSDNALETLKQYEWPGNIRELRNIVERAFIFFPKSKINSDDVKNYLFRISNDVVTRAEEQETIWAELDNIEPSNISSEPAQIDSTPPKPESFAKIFDTHNSIDLRVFLRDIEIVLINAALDRNNGNTSDAAKDLKLLRTTLIEKTKKYGL